MAPESTPVPPHYEGLLAQWQAAQERCRNSLHGKETSRALNFQTPEQLEADLRRMQSEQSNSIVHKLISQLYPCLSTMQSFFLILVASSPPVSIETALFWGILHLIFSGAIRSVEALYKLVTMLNKIKKELAYFQKCAELVPVNGELQSAIIESLVALLEFWIKAQQRFARTSPERLINDGWANIDNDFVETMNKLNEAVEDVHRYALLEAAKRGSASQLNEAGLMLANLRVGETQESLFPCYCLPAKMTYYFGRTEEAAKITRHLDRNVGLEDLLSFVIYGLGGSGKTATAQAYAQACRKNNTYDAIFWIRSQTPADVQDSFIQVARTLGLAAEENDADTVMVKINTWLARTKKRWLLIYDNVEEYDFIRKTIPTGNGRLLVTTRYKWLTFRFKGSRTHELRTFNDSESLEMFEELCQMYDTDRDRTMERAQSRLLLQELGGLALAIDLMAAYVSYMNIPIMRARKQIDLTLKSILFNEAASLAEKGLAAIWDVQFQGIKGTLAAKVLGLLALLAPDSIPMDLLVPDGDKEWDNEILEILGHSSEQMYQAVNELMKRALIKVSDETITIHRLVQKCFLETRMQESSHAAQAYSAERQEQFDTVCKVLNSRYPKSDVSMSHWGRWEICARYFPHVLSVAHIYEAQARTTDSKLVMSNELSRVIRNCAWYQYECGNHKECLELVEIARNGCEDRAGLEYAHICSHGACAHYELHQVAKGKELIEQSFNIRIKLMNSNDGQLANAYNNRGLLEASECRWDEALKSFDESLKIREKDNNIYVAASHLLKGMAYISLNRLEEGERELLMTKNLCKEIGHKMDLLSTHHLFWQGNLAIERGQIHKAEEFFRTGRSIIQRLAPTYIAASAFEYKLGYVKTKLGNLDEAIKHFDQSIEIAKHREIEGEQARSYRMKAVALRLKDHLSGEEEIEASKAEEVSNGMLRRYFEENQLPMEGLSDDAMYEMFICAQRR
ncbi:hypothetical protein F5Y10DRAFT_263299 [Nemania abortiva]|nr:hypothetical protein F5Y10DRAFT_263299 [Nemania abortiva]